MPFARPLLSPLSIWHNHIHPLYNNRMLFPLPFPIILGNTSMNLLQWPYSPRNYLISSRECVGSILGRDSKIFFLSLPCERLHSILYTSLMYTCTGIQYNFQLSEGWPGLRSKRQGKLASWPDKLNANLRRFGKKQIYWPLKVLHWHPGFQSYLQHCVFVFDNFSFTQFKLYLPVCVIVKRKVWMRRGCYCKVTASCINKDIYL